MTAQSILGEPLAEDVRASARRDAARVLDARGRAPRLAIVAASSDAARIYARRLVEDAQRTGVDAAVHELPSSASTDAAVALVEGLARDPAVDGILLQTPLPEGVDAARLAEAIPAGKDVDGATRASAGAVAQGLRQAFYPATAAACLDLVRSVKPEIAGLRALVIGRSLVVGRPVALGLLARDATVTIAHSKSCGTESLAREADLIVAAAGKPCLVEPSWIRPGAVVIDVGIHRVTDPGAARRWLGHDPQRWEAFERKGSAVVGDCHPRVAEVAGALTPVPGGVGPLTSAVLLRHVVRAAQAGLDTNPQPGRRT